MLAERNPSAAYRRIEFDARVAGSDGRELLAVCYERLLRAIGDVRIAAARADNAGKSAALTRALTAVNVLQLGVDRTSPVAPALDAFYAGARRTLLDAAIAFDAAALDGLRSDIAEIAAAMARS